MAVCYARDTQTARLLHHMHHTHMTSRCSTSVLRAEDQRAVTPSPVSPVFPWHRRALAALVSSTALVRLKYIRHGSTTLHSQLHALTPRGGRPPKEATSRGTGTHTHTHTHDVTLFDGAYIAPGLSAVSSPLADLSPVSVIVDSACGLSPVSHRTT